MLAINYSLRYYDLSFDLFFDRSVTFGLTPSHRATGGNTGMNFPAQLVLESTPMSDSKKKDEFGGMLIATPLIEGTPADTSFAFPLTREQYANADVPELRPQSRPTRSSKTFGGFNFDQVDWSKCKAN